MKIILSTLVISVFLTVCFGDGVSEADAKLFNSEFSLTELVHQSSLPVDWELVGATKFESGRFILTPDIESKGSVWHKKGYPLKEAFTIEWTVRSLRYQGKSSGGLSLWFVSDTGDKTISNSDVYDGLQIYIDNNSDLGSTARAIFNDGSMSLSGKSLYDHTFGSCLVSYQSSSVPLTAQLSYDSSNNLLKLQIDNKVCFQTKKVKFPKQEYRIGVSAQNSETPESFELLKLKVFDGRTKVSLLPNVKALSQPRIVKKTINKKTGEEKLVEASSLDLSDIDFSNLELFKKIDKLEGKVLANDLSYISRILERLVTKEQENSEKISALTSTIEHIFSGIDTAKDSNFDDVFRDFYQIDEKLEKLLQEQQANRELNKQREILNKAGPHADEIVAKLMIWLIPLGALMVVMAYYTFRIRQDIVKSKLL